MATSLRRRNFRLFIYSFRTWLAQCLKTSFLIASRDGNLSKCYAHAWHFWNLKSTLYNLMLTSSSFLTGVIYERRITCRWEILIIIWCDLQTRRSKVSWSKSYAVWPRNIEQLLIIKPAYKAMTRAGRDWRNNPRSRIGRGSVTLSSQV